MTSREDFIAAVQSVDQRLEALRPRILEQPEAPLPEGSWKSSRAVLRRKNRNVLDHVNTARVGWGREGDRTPVQPSRSY